MNKKNVLYFAVLTLIPIFVVSILYKSLINLNINKTKKEINYTIHLVKGNEKIKIPLEEYILGVLAGEMPASFEVEALKAQAVASRTYAIYMMNKKNKLESSINDQVYLTNEEMKLKWGNEYNKYYNKLKEVIEETKDLIMTKNNNVFKSFYFSMSNGHTEDSIAVFNEGNIKGVLSPWDNITLNKFEVTIELSKEELINKLNIENIDNIEINRDENGRVKEIMLDNKIYTGIEFRKKLSLRSTDFDIETKSNKVLITTRGNGHGVGMSQYGANGMAKENYTYKEILKYYYQDIEIQNIEEFLV